ncbi:aminoacyl-tRNA hydrolase [Algoriphagus kandeliae]|uniref:Aminoacyl-tRNA hydrolase n=1 Tax=Algoriphagus kandeliae TaxID=2562278 RepID=A0A4Y9QJI2_9BACT|nr:alternative ribosome rescue aminoacyl-tRNA hydrolase ArfB [Algoriphagus kandeliae]TFV92337.1 aminoacyl-tRNA hydrolase [Algoriphagus kandeliae]
MEKRPLLERIQSGEFENELQFKTSRSSGPGGQHVNKVETKVELLFNIGSSIILSDEEKNTLRSKVANKIDQEDILHLTAQEKRSQTQNKELVIQKFYDLLRKAFQKKKIRKATKPSKSAIENRLKEKKARGEKKSNRGWKPDL